MFIFTTWGLHFALLLRNIKKCVPVLILPFLHSPPQIPGFHCSCSILSLLPTAALLWKALPRKGLLTFWSTWLIRRNPCFSSWPWQYTGLRLGLGCSESGALSFESSPCSAKPLLFYPLAKSQFSCSLNAFWFLLQSPQSWFTRPSKNTNIEKEVIMGF